jgi:hypothetical protein
VFSQAPANKSARLASQVSRKLRSPSLWLEPDHTSNITHALTEHDCQIGRLPNTSIGRDEARCNTASELVRAVRPASLAASARLWRLENAECQRLSHSNSCTLRARSKRGAPMQAPRSIIQVQVQSSALRTLTSPSKREMQPVFQQPPNPSIEGTASGLRPPAAPHVKR